MQHSTYCIHICIVSYIVYVCICKRESRRSGSRRPPKDTLFHETATLVRSLGASLSRARADGKGTGQMQIHTGQTLCALYIWIQSSSWSRINWSCPDELSVQYP